MRITNMTKTHMVRSIAPLAGLALVTLFIIQARGLRAGTTNDSKPAIASNTHRVIAEGRLVTYPGAEVEIGTDLAGTLTRVWVSEKSAVKKGDVLAELRADDYRAELAEAKAGVSEADANLRLAQQKFARVHGLVSQNVDSEQSLDQAERDVNVAAARREAALATVRRLDATLVKTEITSPIDGVVVSRLVDTGETVQDGQALFTVADLSRVRVEVEVDEFDAGRIHLGDPVTLTAEGYENQSWRGRVEEIPDTVVPRRLRPTDPGRPGDTRVLLVKIALDETTPLKIGQRVETHIGND
jgi:RND family efflux transporter MFP subunit